MREKNYYSCHFCGKVFFARRKVGRNVNVYCSRKCATYGNAKCERFKPTYTELLYLLDQKNSYVHIGKLYGVSDNAVKKWAIKYGLHFPTHRESLDVLCSNCGKNVRRQHNRRFNENGKARKHFFCKIECKAKWQEKNN